MFGLSNRSDYSISNRIFFLVKLLMQKFCWHILYIYVNNDRNLRALTPDSERAITGLHVSPLEETGTLTFNIMFHKN